MKPITALLLLSMGVAACRDAPTSVAPALGREIEVEVGEHITFRNEGFTIRFLEVATDSRCPKGLSCFWAGNATIRLAVEWLARGTAGHVFALNTYLEPKQASYANYTIQLVSLNPYPEAGMPIPDEAYVVTLLVTRGDPSD